MKKIYFLNIFVFAFILIASVVTLSPVNAYAAVGWTPRTSAGQHYSLVSITSSSDGTKLAAVDNNGFIYTSTDSGATWTQQTNAGRRSWSSITSSSDGTKLAAVVSSNGYIYTSIDSGATWTQQTSAGQRTWQSITSSSDGTKLAAVDNNNGYIYTYWNDLPRAKDLSITTGSNI